MKPHPLRKILQLKIGKYIIMVGILILCLGIVSIILEVNKGINLAEEAPFYNPTKPFDHNILAGTWSTKYSESRSEQLIIRQDGKYRQIYKEDGNVIETPWNNWYIVELDDGRLQLNLSGGKFFFDGASAASNNTLPCPPGDTQCDEIAKELSVRAYDWIGNRWIDMYGRLILNIRQDSSGNILLLHLWKSSDRGFPILGGEAEIFRRTDNQN